MPKGVHIKWDEDWIKKNFDPALSHQQMAALYDEAHGTTTKPRTMEDICHRLNLTRWNCKNYTDDEIQFIKEYWPKKGSIWCSENIVCISGNRRSEMAIRNKAQDLNLKASPELWAKNIEANASKVRKSEGTIKINKGSGVPYIKVGKDWVPVAVTIYGKPQKGNMLCYLDGDKTNCTKENIVELIRSETAYMTHNKFWSKHPIITKTGIVCVKLIEAQKRAAHEATNNVSGKEKTEMNKGDYIT